MKKKIILPAMLMIITLTFFSCNSPQKDVSVGQSEKADMSWYTGQWTIDIGDGSVGWIEVRQEDGYPDAEILWGGGSVLPVSNIFCSGNSLIIQRSNDMIRKKDENGNPLHRHTVTSWLEISRAGEKISGLLLTPRSDGTSVDTTLFEGTRLPQMNEAPDLSTLKFGEPISLFNGSDLTGWKLVNQKQTNGFKVIDGVLVNDPIQTEGAPHISYGNLRTENVFEDFNLKLEVNVPPGNNSGIYLRGMYEIQVVDSYKKPVDPHNMGAVYSRITPVTAAEKPAGEWQTLDITLCKRHATVILNGVKIIDNQPVYGPTGGAIQSDVFSPGPIYFQGDHGKVFYRNILLTPVVY